MGCHTKPISKETALRLVADEDRRRVLNALIDSSENTASLQELADQMAVLSAPGGVITETNRSTVKLKHAILPRLDESGLIEYDWRSETVRYRPDENLEQLIEFVSTELE